MDSRDEALIVVRDWLEKGIPAVQPKAEIKKPPRPITTELSTAQVLSELKNAELSPQDVVKIEKVLKEKGLINLIVRKDAPEAEALTDYLDRFWDYSRSPYVEEKLSHKVSIGKAHTSLSCHQNQCYWRVVHQYRMVVLHQRRTQVH
ncbi:hypothetical protein FACS189491_01550 [Spirochaetia bacterium]|nr:hypothetical protein FACS189491_01550 [Spirochaetia bacterium]